MYRISKEFHFAAAHKLVGLAPGHKCGRLHGHNYIVVLELFSIDLDDTGFVIDYGDMKPFADIIKNELDHRNLNNVMPAHLQTSAENLAAWLYDRASKFWPDQVFQVKVSETPKTWAMYSG